MKGKRLVMSRVYMIAALTLMVEGIVFGSPEGKRYPSVNGKEVSMETLLTPWLSKRNSTIGRVKGLLTSKEGADEFDCFFTNAKLTTYDTSKDKADALFGLICLGNENSSVGGMKDAVEDAIDIFKGVSYYKDAWDALSDRQKTCLKGIYPEGFELESSEEEEEE
jgi:hypothetical protein